MKRNSHNKKAQMEIIGLAIVVILISLGLLIMVKLNLNQTSGTDPKKSYSNTEIASNALYSLIRMSTNTCKPGTTMTTLLQDCATDQVLYCTQSDVDGVSSCEFANKTIDYVLTETLAKWDKSYSLTFDDKIGYQYVYNNCTQEEINAGKFKAVDNKNFYIPLYPGTLSIYLSICST